MEEEEVYILLHNIMMVRIKNRRGVRGNIGESMGISSLVLEDVKSGISILQIALGVPCG